MMNRLTTINISNGHPFSTPPLPVPNPGRFTMQVLCQSNPPSGDLTVLLFGSQDGVHFSRKGKGDWSEMFLAAHCILRDPSASPFVKFQFMTSGAYEIIISN